MKVDVLGTKYTIHERSKAEDSFLETCDGYCDKTSKTIVIVNSDNNCYLDDFGVYRKKLLRHEIIHAFLFESGLHENFKHEQWGHDETQIDWFAVQFPKLLLAFTEAGAL